MCESHQKFFYAHTTCLKVSNTIIAFFFSVAQINAAAKKEQYEEHEMSKPLARYADDEDLERMLKERKRDGDPMLMFMKTSKRHTIRKSNKG